MSVEAEIVGEAGDGLQALELFKSKKPDIVTMDITMPEMDGLSSMVEMLKVNPEARIVVITALADRATALDAMDKGAAGFVAKPFTSESLWEALEPVLKS